MKNRVLEKFKAHKPSIGTISHLKSMAAMEALGAAGLDYVVIDMEHAPTSIDEAARYITAADAAGITPFVRVCEATRSALLRPLDVGAMGVIVPCLETVEQVRELVDYAKFQPVGSRGYCMTRDGRWGYGPAYEDGMAGYMERSNQETLFIPQCETAGCLANIEAISAMDGVDGVMVGPYDLSIAMGIPGEFGAEAFQTAVDRILKACKDAGKAALIFTGSAADARSRLDQGFDSAMVGLDLLALIQSYRDTIAEIGKGGD